MIGLILAQLRARWGQVLALLVLSAVGTGAAVSAPAFAAAVDRATVVTELERAQPRELTVSVPGRFREWSQPPESTRGYESVLAALADFDPVTTVQIQVRGLEPDDQPDRLHRLLGQDGFCARVSFVAGRCPVGLREVALPAMLAERNGLAPGDRLALQPARWDRAGVVPDGPVTGFTVVGVVSAVDPDDPYWAAGLDPLGAGGQEPAVLTNPETLQTTIHTTELLYVDAVLRREAMRPEAIPRLREQLALANDRQRAAGLGENLVTSFPELLRRIDQQGDQSRALLPVVVAPLVLLCWLVAYLVVAYGLAARRRQVAVAVLRGARFGPRTLVAGAEGLLAVLAGGLLGVASAYPVGWLAGPAGPGLRLDLPVLLAAGMAGTGMVAAMLLAMRRELAASVAQLLRRVPARGRAAVATGEIVLVSVAAAVVADLTWFDRELTGPLLAAPAVVMLAVVVLVSRLVRLVADVAGKRSLRRGWLAPAIGSWYLSRRSGAGRVVVVLGMVLGLAGFGLVTPDIAGTGRAAAVERELGAARILEISGVDPRRLLTAVAAADPTGRYALPVLAIPASGTEPTRLAVDSSRLRVAAWPKGADLDPHRVARLLRPESPEPILVADGELTARLALDADTDDRVLAVSARLAPVGGGELVFAEFGPLTAGQERYQVEVSQCPDGCRLAGFGLTFAEGAGETRPESVGVTVGGLSQPGAEVLDLELLRDPSRWRGTEITVTRVELEPARDGLRMSVPSPQRQASYPVLAVDAPYPMPVVRAGAELDSDQLTNLDGNQIQVTEAAVADQLPGLHEGGVLLDLEYASRAAIDPGGSRPGQVWLTPDAPAEVEQRLVEAGLRIRGARSVDHELSIADRSGAALAMRLFLAAAVVAAGLGMLALGLVIGVDRRAWSGSLAGLRGQGVPGAVLTRAGLWAYGVLVAGGAVAGAGAALAAWLVTVGRLPFGVDPAMVPAAPQVLAVLLPWLAIVSGLGGLAVAGAWWQRAGAAQEVRG